MSQCALPTEQEIKKLDVITPCFNPVLGWEKHYVVCTRELQKHLPELEFHFIIVNDGSDANFLDLQVHYLHKYIKNLKIVEIKNNAGKGNAIRQGLIHSKSNYAIYTDIDFPYTVDSVKKIWNQLLGGNDVVCGQRSDAYYAKIPLQRKIISKILRFLNKNILNLPVVDTQCGLKGMSIKGKSILTQTKINHFLFDVEFIGLAHKQKDFKIVPQEVELRPQTKVFNVGGGTILREFKNFIKILFRVKF